ncbi:MAG: protein-methionine-sulfoxide reductase catalytic subunit MsrP [Nitrospinae bacterium]|nr:protein-methionine-sulfoxide reductase catalytic subunit MsrP [Nitrospinota bacterium]
MNEPVTPEWLYLSRRRFIKGLAALGVVAGSTPLAYAADNLSDEITPFEKASAYNNFYEFSLGKTEPADLAKGFVTSPWRVAVGGLVAKPATFDMKEILARFPQRDRVYRLRCVEAWSMVIPWRGFPLAALLDEVKPAPEAKFVRFETAVVPKQMPGVRAGNLPFPYVEGLRIDEARHPLAILATGMYGKPLPPQNGAPIRLVVPWKYGFKSIKSVVKIDLVAEQPRTTWQAQNPAEYGFYANVNPTVDHPRWSQASERRIGEWLRRKTLPFNGYMEVASLYKGMDLTKNF